MWGKGALDKAPATLLVVAPDDGRNVCRHLVQVVLESIVVPALRKEYGLFAEDPHVVVRTRRRGSRIFVSPPETTHVCVRVYHVAAVALVARRILRRAVCYDRRSCARSSVGESTGLLSRGSQVRVLPGAPMSATTYGHEQTWPFSFVSDSCLLARLRG